MTGRPVRAGFVIDELTPGAGTENQLLRLLRAFDRGRVEPHVCCLRGTIDRSVIASDSPVERLGVTRVLAPAGFAAMRRLGLWARERELDVVVTFFRDANIVGTLGASLQGIPVVSSRRNLGYWQNGVERAVLRLLARLTVSYIANSVAARDRACATEGIEPQVVDVIPNVVDTERFSPATPERRLEARRRLELPDDAFVVGCVANLRPVKNLPLLLRAFAKARDRIAPARLVLVGEGPSRPELETLRDELGLAGETLLLGGRSDVESVIASFDCGILPSASESQSNALLELMAAGVPIAASDNPGNRDLLDGGQFGKLFDTQEPEALADTLIALERDPEGRSELAAAGRSYVEATHAIGPVIDAWERHLHRAAGATLRLHA